LLITHQEEVVLIADRASQLGATHIVFPGGLKETVDHVLGEAASDATGVHGVRKSNMENARWVERLLARIPSVIWSNHRRFSEQAIRP
jgi:hypothetical protein